MDFINEQHRSDIFWPALRRIDDIAQIFDAIQNSVQCSEFGVRLVGDNVGDGCFACACWPPQQDRGQLIGFNGAAEQSPLTDDVLLSDKFIETARAHSFRKRFFRSSCTALCSAKQVIIILAFIPGPLT